MINAHGGKLINKIAAEEEKILLGEKAKTLIKVVIADRYVSDCEMIANGGFSPLNGFMTSSDAEQVINNLQLANGEVWSIPVLLPLAPEYREQVKVGDEIALFDKNDRLISLMIIEETFSLDLENYFQKVYKTNDEAHPGVKAVKDGGDFFIGGELIRLVNRPLRESIAEKYFLDPAQTRKMFADKGWKSVVAFQTRNPIHRAHEYLIKCALESLDGALVHPLVGETKSDDIPADVRMECYEELIDNYFSQDKTALSVLPAAMRYAGPREAVHHMIIRKNYGCTHMIIGRDHAGVGNYYGTYEAQELVDTVAANLEIVPIKFEHSFYCTKCGNMASQKTCPHTSSEHLHLSGTKVRDMLRAGERPPVEFSRGEVADILIKWARST